MSESPDVDTELLAEVRDHVLWLTLTDGRKIQLALKSRQYAEGGEGQDLRKVAAFIRNEMGLPEG